MPEFHVAIIGAGIGGLACAARLAAVGCRVSVFESQAAVGGKLRRAPVGGVQVDRGPTVFTMRWVFDELFEACGASLPAAVRLQPLAVLARHGWAAGGRLDLFADRAASADAIGSFAGAAEARGYLDFCARAARVYGALEASFIRGEKPTMLSLVAQAGFGGIAGLARISPFQTLWEALGAHFRDPRLRQLFGRYATYCGASPFAAPATLMLIAHVEQEGVWSVDGGMHALAQAVADLAAANGAALRLATAVTGIAVAHGQACGVRLADGTTVAADAVVLNGDAQALVAGLFGADARPALVDAGLPRSLSAVTFAIAGRPQGFPLVRHNVFFSEDYAAEFDALRRGHMPARPSVYLCAQSRDDAGGGGAAEPLFAILNAPADGDRHGYDQAVTAQVSAAMMRLFDHCGLELTCDAMETTTPADFAALFPATGGALYGPATHGATASFRRPGTRTRLPGLYLAGGSVHPGPGVPMAALSGRLAARAVLADRPASQRRSCPAATGGGISTR